MTTALLVLAVWCGLSVLLAAVLGRAARIFRRRGDR